jgi:predicted permease
MGKNALFYVAVLLVFGGGIWFVLGEGARLGPATAAAEQVTAAVHPAEQEAAAAGTFEALAGNLRHPLAMLLLQILIIVVAARSLGSLFRRMGQPPVIGEMVAGILLGPSLLGWIAPAAQSFVFPASSLGSLQMLSQVGVILFMFIVGTELDVEHLRKKAHAAVMVSHASIVVPFFLGVLLALFLYK